MKWTDNTTFAFVQEYLKHECLYNSKCNNYRIKQARDTAIIKICEVMNISDFGPKEAVSKIKSIRSTYSQELKKINESTKSGAGTDDVYVPTLKWFKIYHNVIKDKNLTPKESQSNLNSVKTAMEGIASGVDESTSQVVPGSSQDSQDTPIIQETEAAKKPVYSRKRNIKCLESLVNKVRAVGEMVQTPMANNDNEFDIFGRSVAAQLNAIPLMLALRAQSHIQNYLTSLRMHSIANPLNLQAYSPPSPSHTTYISVPSPSINSSVSGVSMDNNRENLEVHSPPAVSPTYHMPSTVVINSSGSGVSMDNNRENLEVHSPPAVSPTYHIPSTVVINSSVSGVYMDNYRENLEVHSPPAVSPTYSTVVIHSSVSGPTLDSYDDDDELPPVFL